MARSKKKTLRPANYCQLTPQSKSGDYKTRRKTGDSLRDYINNLRNAFSGEEYDTVTSSGWEDCAGLSFYDAEKYLASHGRSDYDLLHISESIRRAAFKGSWAEKCGK